MTPHGRRKKSVRKLVREAEARARGAAAGEPKAPVPKIELYEMTCVCGQRLQLTTAYDEKRCSCPRCGRKFEAAFTDDPSTGRKVLNPLYLDDAQKSGETLIVEAAGPAAPPPQIDFSCPCGKPLMARREMYDRRVRCRACGARMILNVVHDPDVGVFRIHPVRVGDASAGDTLLLDP